MKYAAFLLHSASLSLKLDILERATATIFFGFFAFRMFDAYLATGSLGYLTLLMSECLVVGFILVRRTTREVSLLPADWVLAVAGTVLPLLIAAGGKPLVPNSIASMLMLVGIFINIWAKLALRRSFGVVAANRGVKTEGPYRFIRHPMYFGYVVTQVGFFLLNPTLWNLVIYAAALTLQVLRLLAEERVLSRDPKYAMYIAKVRYRLIVGIF